MNKIAIIGTGGVGGYFGAKLARSGYDVSFLARGAHKEMMQMEGLHIKSIDGDFHIDQPKVYDRIQNMGLSDLILVAVKAWQVKEVRNELRSIMHPDSMVIPLQNGVMAADELSEMINPLNVLGGLCRIFSQIEKPGTIHHFGVTPTIVFGELDHSDSVRLHGIKEIFDHAGIKSKISLDIDAELWKKFIAICVGGLLAISRTNYGELRKIPETRQMMIDLLNEVYSLSQKMHINIQSDFVKKTISFVDTFPYESTTSLARDIWEGKPSEIEYQNGSVVRLAEKSGLETPVNRFVYHCILPMELKARNQI